MNTNGHSHKGFAVKLKVEADGFGVENGALDTGFFMRSEG
jgi:hypothetical protein